MRRLSLSYWMNRLQPLPTATNIFVTLNPGCDFAPGTVVKTIDYEHPLFTGRRSTAQGHMWRIQGTRHTWFAGAWLGCGFHEDGLQSGLEIAERLGPIDRPWSVADARARIIHNWSGGADAVGGGMTSSEDGALYVGAVVHKRLRPKAHSLRYGVFSMLVDLDRLDELSRRLRWFSVGRFNLFSLYPIDFGPRDGTPLAAFARQRAAAAGLDMPIARVRMLFYPRILGYAFNPLTVYYLDDAAGQTLMLVFEVHNTFGERHFYDAADRRAEAGRISLTLPKAFLCVAVQHAQTGRYRFTIRLPDAEVFTGIVLSDDEGPLVNAYFAGARQALTDAGAAAPCACLSADDAESHCRDLLGSASPLAQGRAADARPASSAPGERLGRSAAAEASGIDRARNAPRLGRPREPAPV